MQHQHIHHGNVEQLKFEALIRSLLKIEFLKVKEKRVKHLQNCFLEKKTRKDQEEIL